MDAVRSNLKKTVFFLAAALLLMAASPVSAQTLQVSSPTVVLGNNTACNTFSSDTITSSDGSNQTFTVAVTYSPNDTNGNWLQVGPLGNSTTTGATITASTGTSGYTLPITLTRVPLQSVTATVIIVGANNTLQVQVTYILNNTCPGGTGTASNNTISVSPGTVTLTGSQNTQIVTVQNLTVTSLTVVVTVSQTNGTWLTVSNNSLSLSPNGSASFTTTGNASNATASGTLTGSLGIQAYLSTTQGSSPLDSSLPITVTFNTSGSGTGTGPTTGTLTLNNTTSNVYNATMIETNGSGGGFCIPLQDSAGGSSYSFSVTDNGNWLSVDSSPSNSGVALTNIGPGSNACVNLTLSNAATALLSGVYQGSVALTSSSGSAATINVNLYVSDGAAAGISVTPGLVYVFPNVAPGSNFTQEQAFTITAASGVGLGTASVANGTPSWMSMTTPIAANGLETFAVTVNAANLVAGIYSAVITMQSTGSGSLAGGQTYITIVFPVGQPGSTSTGPTGGTSSTYAPTSISFQQQFGTSLWTGGQEAQTISITGAQGSTWTASITYNNGSTGWLTFDSPTSAGGAFGAGPASLVLDFSGGVSNLPASTNPYTATVSITTSGGNFQIPVSVLVTPAGTPVLIGQPSLSTFSYSSGGSGPASQTVTVVSSSNFNPSSSSSGPQITAGTPTASWISATTSGDTLTISVNPAGLSTGSYSGTIPVSATGYANSINYPVVLIVNGGSSASGPLTFSLNPISFTNVTGTVSTNLQVTSSTGTAQAFTVTAQESTCTTVSWLTVATGSYNTGGNPSVSVSANPAGITTGTTCTAILTFQSASATQTVNVSMSVGTASGSGNLSVNTNNLSFGYTQGQSAPAAQTVSISNATTGTASIPFTVSVSSGASGWLQTNVTSAQTPYSLSVSVVPGSMTPNTYTGTVTITPTGGTAQVVNVTLTITGSTVVTATPTTLSLAYTVGQTPPTGTIQVSAGGAQAGFTATASSNSSNWLVVNPASGTTPNNGTTNLTVSLNSSALNSLLPSGSPYTGTITIDGTSPASGMTNINVTLTVTAPLPVISSVVNGASFATGPVSPGEVISLFAPSANPIGPATAVALSSTTCPSPCTSIPNTMGGVTVTFEPSGVSAPLTYVSSTQVNAIVPYSVVGLANLSVEVTYLGQKSNFFSLTQASTAPGVFTTSNGTGEAAVLQYSPTTGYQGVNSASNQAQPGWTLVFYMTGEGSLNVTNPSSYTGAVTQYNANANPPVPQPFYAPTVTIGAQPATVTFYGEAPGIVSGVLQVNVTVPANAPAGSDQVQVMLGGNSSQTGATVYIQ